MGREGQNIDKSGFEKSGLKRYKDRADREVGMNFSD
jgi:hypothetical protein